MGNDIKTYGNIRKIAKSRVNDYITGCLLDYTYFKENYKMIVLDLIKQLAFDVDPRAIQQTNLTRNSKCAAGATMYLILEEVYEIIMDFLQRAVKIL